MKSKSKALNQFKNLDNLRKMKGRKNTAETLEKHEENSK